MGKNENILVSFTFEEQEQHFKIKKNKLNIGEEIVKFICYLEDYKMLEYFTKLVRNKQLNFKEAFCITNLKKDTLVEEIFNRGEENFVCEYVLDFDCEYLCHIKTSLLGFRNYTAYPFEQLAEYPYSEKFQE
jgi:hypothetical protein